MILQVILLAGLLFRINQVYVIVVGGGPGPGILMGSGLMVEEVSADNDPSLGPGPITAPVTIIEFSDFTCGYCRLIQETLEQVKELYGEEIQIIYRDFPRAGPVPGTVAFNAAVAAECSAKQGKFQEMHDLLFKNQPRFDPRSLKHYAAELDLDLERFDKCLESEIIWQEVRADYEDGVRYGVRATPTFFINGRVIIGAVPLSEFERLIDLALQE